MTDDSPPDSPLSSVGSDEEMLDDTATPNRSTRPSVDTIDGPPSKRRRTGASAASFSTFSANDRASSAQIADDDDLLSDLSEDGFSSAPGSPSHDEYALRADQVTKCQWDTCTIGELGDSDSLIKHVQIEHIAPKRAKYTCEWGDCARKGINHPSGYALKAHMRSHTKEKPFFCALPECDRSFTRSDALAKHMRTVHEPEPPKASATNANPIDPLTGQPKKGPKIRLVANGNKASSADPASTAKHPDKNPANAGLTPDDPNWDPSPPNDNIQYIPAHHPITGQPGFMITYPPDINFSAFESEIPADQLMRLLRRQVHWAQQEGERLKREVEQLESLRRDEWVKKELLLEGVMSGELAHAKKQGLLADAKAHVQAQMERDLDVSKTLKWTKEPWWKSGEDWAFKDRKVRVVEPEKSPEAEEVDGDEELDGDANAMAEIEEEDTPAPPAVRTVKEQNDDDMSAVEALMGLSGVKASA